MECTNRPQIRIPWNKGKLVGQKAPFKPKEVWAIRARLQMENRARELALFDLGIDSKLRACDLVKLRVRDVCHGDRVDAAHQGVVDLPADEESARGPTPAWPFEVGVDRALPWYRS